MQRFSNLLFVRLFQVTISRIASIASRVQAYFRRTPARTLCAKGGYFLFLGCVSIVLLGNDKCEDDNPSTS